MTTYTITSTHTFEYTVEADTLEQAEDLGQTLPDNAMAHWVACESAEAEEE
jgi:hypothetical protein